MLATGIGAIARGRSDRPASPSDPPRERQRWRAAGAGDPLEQLAEEVRTRERRRLTEAERRERQRRRRLLRRRLRLALLVGGVVFLGICWWQVPRLSVFQVRQVAIVGASAVPDLRVRNEAQPLLAGHTIYTLDEDRIARRIARMPFVREVRVERHFPDTVAIHVSEYEPLAFGMSGKRGWLVARDGRILTTARLGDWSERVPVVQLEEDDARAGDRVGDEPALRLLRALPSAFPGAVRTVGIENGLLVATLHDGPELRVGRPVDLTAKLLVAQRLLSMYGPGSRGRVKYLDVSVASRPAVRLE